MAALQKPKVTWQELVSEHGGATLLLVSSGVWLHAADGLLVSTMMPSIVADIGGAHHISWTVSLYELGSIVAGAASALVALRYGLRAPMIIAALLFAIGCSVAALAPRMDILLLGRLLQGLGGGGLMALSFVTIGRLYPGRLLGRAMGVVSTIWAVSAFLGPLIGGLFVELSSWRNGFWVFTLQAILLAIWIAKRQSHDQTVTQKMHVLKFPFLRIGLLAAAVFLVASAGGALSVSMILLWMLGGLGCLIAFFAVDRKSGALRILPEGGIGFGTTSQAGLMTVFCFAAATIAIGTYGPFFIVNLHQTSALTAGYIVALEAIFWTLTALVMSGAPEVHDRRNIATGLIVVVISILVFAVAIPSGNLWLIVFGAVLQGTGFGLSWTFILRRCHRVATSDDKERASAAIPTLQRLGFALGASYCGLFANRFGLGSGFDPYDYQNAALAVFAACVPLAGIGLFAGFRFIREVKDQP